MKVINLDHISAKPLLPEVKKVMIEAIEKELHQTVKKDKDLQPICSRWPMVK